MKLSRDEARNEVSLALLNLAGEGLEAVGYDARTGLDIAIKKAMNPSTPEQVARPSLRTR